VQRSLTIPEQPGGAVSAIDKGSWVTPQLAVAAFLRDPMFADHAQECLRSGCLIDASACAGLPALERHVSTGPAGTVERSAKTAASLVRLLEPLPHQPDWLTTELHLWTSRVSQREMLIHRLRLPKDG